MENDHCSERLSRISTLWTMFHEAHQGSPEQASAACRELLARYGGAVHRYLRGIMRDPDAANDLAQEFALRFVRGDFHRANAQRGRFRDYLKTALSHLIADYYRQRQNWHQAFSNEGAEPAAPAESSADSATAFRASWREELLASTWKALLQANPRYHAVLQLRVEQPDLTSAQAAEQLSVHLGEPCNSAWVRKTLQRAHDKYAELLLEEVAQSLPVETVEALRQELHELELLKYCETALERWSR
jgi:RNA polymerase sigma-70 factor (ECF subfamily)